MIPVTSKYSELAEERPRDAATDIKRKIGNMVFAELYGNPVPVTDRTILVAELNFSVGLMVNG